MKAKQFFYDIGKALYRIDSFYDEFAKQYNVSSALLWVLYALNDGKSHTQIEICTDWQLPKTTVNTVIKDLQQQGYVNLVPIKGKRREMSIELTEDGKDYSNQLLEDLYEIEAKVFQQLSENEKDIVNTLLKMEKCLKEGKRK